MTARGSLIRLLPSVFAIQAGYHGFTGALPVALAAADFRESQIGVVVGTAFAVQIIAAPVVGAALDRFGPHRLLLAGIGAYLLATVLMAVVTLDPAEPPWILLVARAFQGIGFAVVIPAVLTFVPLLVGIARRGMWLAVVLLAQNLTLAVLPAVSLLILDLTSFRGVAVAVGIMVLVGTVLVRHLPPPAALTPGGEESARLGPPSRRRWGLTYRAEWTGPLLITVLAVSYWGAVLAYLPPRAEVAGTSSAFFFVGYGVAVLSSRVATGWLADRYQAWLLVSVGLAVSCAAIGLLIVPPTALTLIGAGLGSGLSAGLVLSPILLELSHRSSGADRGSAFALFSVVSGGGNALGSIAAGPIVENLGFPAAMLAGLAGVGAAAVLTIFGSSLRRQHVLPDA